VEPRVSLITLGVSDLDRAVAFYRDGLGWPKSNVGGDEVAFFKTGGVVIALFPRTSFAADASVEVADIENGRFSRFSLAHNVAEEEQVDSVLNEQPKPEPQLSRRHRRSSLDATVSSQTTTASCGRWHGTLPFR